MSDVENKLDEYYAEQNSMARKLSKIALLPPEVRKAFLKENDISEEDLFQSHQELGQQIEPGEQGIKSAFPSNIGNWLTQDQGFFGTFLNALFLYATPTGFLLGYGLEKTATYLTKHLGAGEFTQEMVGLVFNMLGFVLGEGGSGKALSEAIPGTEGEEIKKELEEFATKHEQFIEKLKEAIKPAKGEEAAKLTPELEQKLAQENLAGKSVSGQPITVEDESLRNIVPGLINKDTAKALESAIKTRADRLNKLVDIYAGLHDEERKLLHPVIVDEFLKFSELARNEVVETTSKAGKTVYKVIKADLNDEILKKEALKEEFPGVLQSILNQPDAEKRLGVFMRAQKYSDDIHAWQVAALLWEPALWIRKAATDFMHLPMQRLARSVGVIPKVGLTEAAKLFASSMHAMLESIGDAARIMGKTLRTGNPELEVALGKKEPEVFALEGQDAHTLPGLSRQWLSTIAVIASGGERMIMSIDQFSKALSRAGEIRFQSMYRALGEVDGTLVGAERWTHAESIAAQHVAEMKPWLQKAADSAMYRDTFTNKNLMTKGAGAFARVPGLRQVFIFTGVPVNLVARTVDWIPGAGLINAFSVAGTERSAILAKQAMGIVLGMWVFNEARKGNIIGHGPYGDRDKRAAWKKSRPEDPETMWGHKYKEIPGLGRYIGLVADIQDYYDHADPNTQDKLITAVVKASGNFVENVPFMFAMSSLVDTVRASRMDERYGREMIGKWFANNLHSYVPGFLELESMMEDPTFKNTRGFLDTLTDEIPGLGTTPPQTYWDGSDQYLPPGANPDDTPPDRWSVLMNKLNPLGEGEHRNLDAADKAFAEVNFTPGKIPRHIGPPGAIIPITPEQQYEWGKKQGEIKFDDMNIRESMNDLVDSQEYKDAPSPADKLRMLKARYNLYHRAAYDEVGKKYNWNEQIMSMKAGQMQGTEPPSEQLPGGTPNEPHYFYQMWRTPERVKEDEAQQPKPTLGE